MLQMPSKTCQLKKRDLEQPTLPRMICVFAAIALRRPAHRGRAAVEHGVEVGKQLLGEAPLVEADGLAAGGLAAEVGGAGLERPQGVRKASPRLLGEQQAGGLLGSRR